MKTQRLLLALTLTNLLFFAGTLAAARQAAGDARDPTQVLRGRALEIVDGQGRVRASLSVLPVGQAAGSSSDGESSAETVLFRLITERGRPSVKIGASERTAGMSLAGPTGTRTTYVILKAESTTTSLVLRNEDGRERLLQP